LDFFDDLGALVIWWLVVTVFVWMRLTDVLLSRSLADALRSLVELSATQGLGILSHGVDLFHDGLLCLRVDSQSPYFDQSQEPPHFAYSDCVFEQVLRLPVLYLTPHMNTRAVAGAR
jgi:hypothetical protein